MRKSKGQSLSFVLITLISSMLLVLGLITSFDYLNRFDQKAKQLSAPDVSLVVQTDDQAFVQDFMKALGKDTQIREAYQMPILMVASEFEYAGVNNERKAIFIDRDSSPGLGKFTVRDELDVAKEKAIYLPYLFSLSGGYQTGDNFLIKQMTADGKSAQFTYQVAGFYEDIYYSTINSPTVGFLLEKEGYQILEQEFDGVIAGTNFTIRSMDAAMNERIMTKYSTQLGKKIPNGILSDWNNYQMVRTARTVTSSVGAAIIIGFSILLLLISVIILNFRIKNSVEEDIRNIGALKALGYTSKQIIASMLLQYFILALLGCILGILSSFLILPALSAMFAFQTGVDLKLYVSPFVIEIAVISIELLVCVVAYLSAARIRKLPPIIALRMGLQTHSFRKNYFPLEKSRLSMLWAMAGKQLMVNIRQTLVIGLVVVGITFAAAFAGILFYNINVNDEVFVRMVIGETANVSVETVNEASGKRLLAELNTNQKVESAFFVDANNVNVEQDYGCTVRILDEYDKTQNRDWLYQGRFPKYKNEIAINGQLARLLDKKVGDEVQLSKEDMEVSYLITGFIQGSDYMGRDACMTQAAYQQIDKAYVPRVIFVYLKSDDNIDAFVKQLEANSADVRNVINRDKLIRGSLASFRMIVAIVAVFMCVITLFVIGLVLCLVIRTLLLRKRLELGIQKSIGFTTTQLVFQNVFAYLPIILIGVLVGMLIAYFAINPFLSLLFSGIGMMKVTFIIYIPLLFGISFLIVLFGFIISALASLRIRWISPYALISE
jgi:putative ABC transport system permease protein